MAESVDNTKINEALELLDHAARNRLEELQGILSHKYSSLAAALGGAAERLNRQAREAFDHGKEKARDLASSVDDNVHRNPWPYLGGTALGFLILGFSLGKARK
jgi:ElaB/YqjD/DUF883 family membrane-anchored ribosome-binding protein